MDSYTSSGASSPALSFCDDSNIGSPVDIGTPGTDRSTLCAEDDDQGPLGIPGLNSNYVLVVGGLGYIGSHTTLELMKEGYNVLVVDDLSNSYENVLDRIKDLATEYLEKLNKPTPELHFREADYRSPAMRKIIADYSTFTFQPRKGSVAPPISMDGLLTAVVEEKARQSGAPLESEFQALAEDNENEVTKRSRITGVIHFAAFKSVEESIQNPLKYYANNVCGLVDFLTLLDEYGIKNFVFSSSATVYGDRANAGVPLREEFCVHDAETYTANDGLETISRPGAVGITSPYGRTKFMSESILSDVAKSDSSWNITALRYFNPVGCHESGRLGEDPRQKPSNLIPVIANVLTGSRPALEVYGTDWETTDGTAVRDFIHVVDLARGHTAALAAAASGRVTGSFRTYNLGTGIGHTVREVLDKLEKYSGRKIATKLVGRRAGDVGFCVAGVQRAERELRWKAERNLSICSMDVWNSTRGRCKSIVITLQ